MNYIAYYRVSTQKQGLGLDAQQTAVKNYLSSVGGVLIEEYSEKETGKNNRRTELMRAIEECKQTGSTLVIAKLDRLSRNVSFLFALRDSGINFIALDVPTLNTLTLGITATIAQHERELTADRTKKALAELKRQGVKLGRPNAEITDEMREKSAVALSEISRENLNNRRAFSVVGRLRAEGRSLREIADWLNGNGFQTAKGAKFTACAVGRLLEKNW